MREVSCRALDMFFRAAGKGRIPLESLAAGTGYSVAYLRDKHERIEWSSFVRFMRNAGVLWSQDELVAMSAGFLRSPLLRAIVAPARLLFSPEDLYRWGMGQKHGAGDQLFRCIQQSYFRIDSRRARLELTLPPGYEPCTEFFLISKEVFSEVSTLIGLAKADVMMTPIALGVRYDITIPEERGLVPKIRRGLAWPFALRTAASELTDAHEALVLRYEELERAKAALHDLNKSLEQKVEERTAELKATILRLEDAKALRDRIFANVNHEIRTPLSLITLAVAAMRGGPHGSDEAGTRALDAIERSAKRQLRLVDEMLLLAESREHEIRLQIGPCDLRALVAGALQSWAPATRARGLELRAETTTPCLINGDPGAVERILANLISNAVKFTPSGGRIDVRLTSEGGSATLEVRDTGVGIDAELLPRLFGRFERGRGAVSGAVSGSGIGLSIVKELVEAQRGKIEVLAPDGGGALFRVSLPLLVSAEAGAAVVHSATLKPDDFGVVTDVDERELYEPVRAAQATLLLAEDDPELRHRIATVLSEQYRVFVAREGFAALRLAEIHRPDLLVTDIAMPGLDGIELTRRFRALTGSRVAPVLLITAHGEIRDRLAGFEAGAVDYIVKPFEPSELLARIRAQLALRGLALQLVESEKLASLGVLSAGLAHELRNPANGIINAIGPLRELMPPDLVAGNGPIPQLLDVIDECSQRIAAVSRHLLGFRRGADLDRRPVALEALLLRVRATAQPALAGVELREKLEYRGQLRCAEPLMAQALSNLLDNAAYAAGRGGWVQVRTALDEARVVVEFTDSGAGVPAALRARIFEPFFTTKPAGKGTGLGLATAREIVTRHGGTLDVRHSASGASVFRIEMPLDG